MVLSVLPVQEERDAQSEIRPEGVNDHGPAHICSLVDVKVDSFVGRVEHDFEKRDDDELEGARSA